MALLHEGLPARAEGPPPGPTLAKEAWRVQMKLAVLNYRNEHPDVSVNVEAPHENEKTVRDAAMALWLADDDNGPSGKFRAYLAEGHAEDPVDLDDVNGLSELLRKILQPEALH